MDPRDMVLGRVGVERGWYPARALAECLSAAKGGAPLSRILLQRRLIPEDELQALRAEIDRLLRRGASPWADLQEDLRLTESLRDSGELTRERLEEALAAESDPGAPRLREILLEKGFITFAALEQAIHAGRRPATPMTCRGCRATSELARYDPDRVYLCKACTGELVPTAELQPEPPPVRIDAEGAFGKYRVEDELGRGANGVVYKAWDDPHRRWVALKVVRDTGRLEETARFRREVEIARVLHHPNIVATYEVTHVGDRHLIAMQLIDGTMLPSGKHPPVSAARIVATLAHAIQYAHSRNIIHRDIKPQNIMIDRAGTPYLMDFGLAKTAGGSSITAIGTAMGTPSYMSPEQALGQQGRIDRRSDVYSLGAVLYDLVTGQPPFRGANPMDTLTRVVSDPLVPPSRLVPGVPAALERIVLKSMDKDRTQRHSTARQLAEELERFISEEETSNGPAR